MTPDEVPCPSCSAPAGITCQHADRAEAARIASVTWGTCALCGQPLALLADPAEAVHPDPEHAAVCPPMPDPHESWNEHAAAVNAGLSPGYPGVQNFVPAPEALLEAGRQLASQRDDLIAGGANPADLLIPEAPSAERVAAFARATSLGGLPLCPECAQGKVLNCAQQALDPVTDELVPCANAGRVGQ